MTVYVPVKGLENNDQPIEIPESYGDKLLGRSVSGGVIRRCDDCNDLYLSIDGIYFCDNC